MARNITQYQPRGNVVRSGLPGFDDLLREFSLTPFLRELESAPRMKVDVEENDQAYILKAEVPGAKKEDITVSIAGNQVSIRADVVDEKDAQNNGTTIRSERFFGEEFRTFTLPQEVDESKAVAKVENGVLVLTLPKKTGAGAKKLTIQ